LLPVAYKTIDMAAKKHIIHSNNANRKKSQLAKGLAAAQAKKKVAVKEEK
jgi:ribosomal protein S20